MLSRIIRASTEESNKASRFKFTPASSGVRSAWSTAAPVESDGKVWPILKIKPLTPAASAGIALENPSQLERPESVEQQSALELSQKLLRVSETEREAYERGFSEGQKTGGEASEKMVESLLSQYSVSLEELSKVRREVFSSSEREVIRLALEIAKKIITREVTIDEELILTLVRVALGRVSRQGLITIRVNPKDYLFIERHHAAQPDAGPLDETMKLVEDPLIGRGGCVIETENGIIDARIEEQLREIEKGFFE